jgi:hypothetical protein
MPRPRTALRLPSSRNSRATATPAFAAALTMIAIALGGCGSSGSHGSLPPSSVVATVAGTPAGAARTLPPDWLGFNGEAVTGPAGLWGDRRFAAAVAALRPEAIRLFGGTTANYWDWRRGTFVGAAAARMTGVPSELAAARPRVSVSLADWARIVRAARATPVYDLNVVSSTLGEQLAMLRAARGLGLPVTRVELGNELYLGRYRRLFPDGLAYGRVAARWAAALKAAFPGVRVAAVGFVAESSGAPVSSRERSWNSDVLATFKGADALTFHPYFQTGLTAGASPASAGAAAAMLLDPSLRWAAVQAGALAQLKPGVAAWLTEYNLFDRVAAAHTTWAQGLALAAYTLDLLDDSRVDQADVHALAASAPFGALFVDRNGLDFGVSGSRAFHPPRPNPPATQPFGRSATGIATAALLDALRGARRAQPIAFRVVAPRQTAGSPATALRGELFGGDGEPARAVVLNLSPATLLALPPAQLASGGFDQLWAAPPTLVNGTAALDHAHGHFAALGLVLPGYSITVLGG